MINWKVYNREFDGSQIMADIQFEPKNDPLRYAIAQVYLVNYPKFINYISIGEGYGEEFVSIKSFNEVDWEDQAWIKSAMNRELQAGEIFIHHEEMGETIILESIFDKILFDYGSKLLEVYIEDTNMQKKYIEYYNWYKKEDVFFKENPVWAEAMNNSLLKLSQKIGQGNIKTSNTISDIVKYNEHKMLIPVSIGYKKSEYDNVTKEKAQEYINCYSKQSYSWIFAGIKIILEDKKTSIKAYPSINLQYIIAIYKGLEGKYKPPTNAVVYNADGSVYKILKMPILESENILKKIAFNNDSNPPLEASPYEGGLFFSNFDWWKNDQGEIINRIQIIYDSDWIEWRELDLKTGEVGRYLGQGRL
jgi:hypothetical protein